MLAVFKLIAEVNNLCEMEICFIISTVSLITQLWSFKILPNKLEYLKKKRIISFYALTTVTLFFPSTSAVFSLLLMKVGNSVAGEQYEIVARKAKYLDAGSISGSHTENPPQFTGNPLLAER